MQHRSLTIRGYVLMKEKLTDKEIKNIKKDLTAEPVVLPAFREMGFGDTQKFPIYLESARRLYVPKHYGIDNYGPPLVDEQPVGEDICVKFKLPLRENQIKPFNKTVNQLKKVGGGILSLPCGYGKTAIAIKTITALKKKALVIVHKDFLMEQWIDAISFFTDAKVGIIQQNKVEIEGNDICLGMIHSLCLKDYPPGTFEKFGTVIVDECHHLSSEMFSKVLPKTATRYRLGLSATPERRDGLSKVFFMSVGPLFHSEKRSGNNQVLIKQLQISSSSENYNVIFHSNGKSKNTGAMTTAISQYDARNTLIVELVRKMLSNNRKTIILSSRRGHLEQLKELMEKESMKRPDERYATYGFYYGKQGMNKKQYKAMLSASTKCDVILATEQLAKEGLDIPDLDTLIMTSSIGELGALEQSVGRILRKFYDGTINPVVFDIVDMCGNFPKHAGVRRKYYTGEGYPIDIFKLKLNADNRSGIASAIDNYAERLLIEDARKSIKRVEKKEEKKKKEEDIPQGVCLLD